MAVLKEEQLEKISLEFDDDLLTFQHFANYPNLLPYIGKNFSKNENFENTETKTKIQYYAFFCKKEKI